MELRNAERLISEYDKEYMISLDELVHALKEESFRKISEKFSNDRSNRDWRRLAEALNLSREEIEHCENAMEVLIKWKMKHPTTSTIRVLEDALMTIDRKEVIDELNQQRLDKRQLTLLCKNRLNDTGVEYQTASKKLVPAKKPLVELIRPWFNRKFALDFVAAGKAVAVRLERPPGSSLEWTSASEEFHVSY
jgi:hypothetical protein